MKKFAVAIYQYGELTIDTISATTEVEAGFQYATSCGFFEDEGSDDGINSFGDLEERMAEDYDAAIAIKEIRL